MKILIVNHHPCDVLGGSEIQCDLIARQLTRFGHHVVYFAVDGTQADYDTPYDVERGALKQEKFKQVLVKRQPDVVYWRFNRRKLLPSALTCKRLGRKFVFAVAAGTDLLKWSHRTKFATFAFTEKIRRFPHFLRHILSIRFHYWGYYFVDGVIAQLEHQAWKLPVRRQVVIHNSVDDRVIPFQWEKPFIVWIGAFKPVKNPNLFIDLTRHFRDTGVDFLMVGKIAGAYQELVNAPDRPANLHCLGIRPHHEVNGILRQSLFLVQTSDLEGFPNVMIQSWAQGKPTVSLYYDPDNMISDNNLGYVSGNFEQLIKDTHKLIQNETLREKMGARAKQFAKAHFDPEQNIRKFETFFQEICGV